MIIVKLQPAEDQWLVVMDVLAALPSAQHKVQVLNSGVDKTPVEIIDGCLWLLVEGSRLTSRESHLYSSLQITNC